MSSALFNYPSVLGGFYFSACVPATGVAPGTAIGTTAAFVLYNPANSTVRVSVLRAAMGYISGTLGAGTVFHCANTSTSQTAPSGGTTITSVCANIGNSATPVAVARYGATVASGTVPIRPFCSLTAPLATTAVGVWQAIDTLAGEIVLEPGTSYQIQAVAAAGTSPLIVLGLAWEERPMSTNNSSGTSYLTATEFLKRFDARLVGDLCSDTGTRVSANALLTDPNLAAALLDASGDVEASCLRGNHYQPSDLAGLTGAAQARLYRLVGRLTMCYLFERRPDKGPIPETYKVAWDHLDALAEGEQIFGIVEVQNAGQIQTEVEDASLVEARNLVSYQAQRYYGRRANRWPAP